jgi:hypothetical protein
LTDRSPRYLLAVQLETIDPGPRPTAADMEIEAVAVRMHAGAGVLDLLCCQFADDDLPFGRLAVLVVTDNEALALPRDLAT